MKPGEETWKDTLKRRGFCSTKTGKKKKKRLNAPQRMNRNLVIGKREEKLGEGGERERGRYDVVGGRQAAEPGTYKEG